jgi:hypothetical protein
VLVDPSPKFQDHEVGVPVEVSVNCTVRPTVGETGLKVKEALSVEEGATLMTWLVFEEPEA